MFKPLQFKPNKSKSTVPLCRSQPSLLGMFFYARTLRQRWNCLVRPCLLSSEERALGLQNTSARVGASQVLVQDEVKTDNFAGTGSQKECTSTLQHQPKLLILSSLEAGITKELSCLAAQMYNSYLSPLVIRCRLQNTVSTCRSLQYCVSYLHLYGVWTGPRLSCQCHCLPVTLPSPPLLCGSTQEIATKCGWQHR